MCSTNVSEWESQCDTVRVKAPAEPCSAAYPEIGDANFKGALWTFKQQLVWKMWARCGISILLL